MVFTSFAKHVTCVGSYWTYGVSALFVVTKSAAINLDDIAIAVGVLGPNRVDDATLLYWARKSIWHWLVWLCRLNVFANDGANAVIFGPTCFNPSGRKAKNKLGVILFHVNPRCFSHGTADTFNHGGIYKTASTAINPSSKMRHAVFVTSFPIRTLHQRWSIEHDGLSACAEVYPNIVRMSMPFGPVRLGIRLFEMTWHYRSLVLAVCHQRSELL